MSKTKVVSIHRGTVKEGWHVVNPNNGDRREILEVLKNIFCIEGDPLYLPVPPRLEWIKFEQPGDWKVEIVEQPCQCGECGKEIK